LLQRSEGGERHINSLFTMGWQVAGDKGGIPWMCGLFLLLRAARPSYQEGAVIWAR
jgi:hypothetical protein